MRKFVMAGFAIVLGMCLSGAEVSSAGEMAASAAPVETAVIETRHGNIEIEFFSDKAPGHVKNFKELAAKGFYDGTIFHRVIPGFMIQGGDPNSKSEDKSGHGMGGPGYTIPGELNDAPHDRGALSMANSGHPDSGGSQFFICVKAAYWLNGKHTVFGRVIKGMDVADKIVSEPRDPRGNPLERVEMKVTLKGAAQ